MSKGAVHATFPNPALVFPKFPHVYLGVGRATKHWTTKSEGVGLIVRAISYQDFQHNM